MNRLACHECSGARCRDALGNFFKRTCPAAASACYLAEGYDDQVERGCYVASNKDSDSLCDQHPKWCLRCTENYCNDAPARVTRHRPCRGADNGGHLCSEEEDEEDAYLEGNGYVEQPESIMLLSADTRRVRTAFFYFNCI